MIAYKFRPSDRVYVGPVELPDGPTIPAFHTREAPPEQEGHYAVMRNGWVLVAGELPAEPAPAPAPVPASVSRAQGKAALISAGLWPAVLAFVEGIADPTEKALAEVALHDTTEWRRDSAFLNAAAQALGMTEAQLDDLFRTAAQVSL